jgi:hypothetical protein
MAEDDEAAGFQGSVGLTTSGRSKKRKIDEIESGNNETMPHTVGKRTIPTLSLSGRLIDIGLTSDNSLDGFKYKALDPTNNEIRLLELLPRKNGNSVSQKNGIQALLVHASLDKNPQYEALSYTWGNVFFSGQIVLNGHKFAVTENV